ncbi:hypothetical protein NDU88_001681 [Pleurodeles waltl]|uniref:Uncharacterized protein n=1 Tax=Pleurodeles waltl TaxID=8319 RepID=A0AAV7UVE3_PLEWA|nr:hypothetical protein NDU88_001681 [Pleurodeles waltl]
MCSEELRMPTRTCLDIGTTALKLLVHGSLRKRLLLRGSRVLKGGSCCLHCFPRVLSACKYLRSDSDILSSDLNFCRLGYVNGMQFT